MAGEFVVSDDLMERADTMGSFPKGHDGGGAEPTGSSFMGFVRRYRRFLSMLLAILIFVVTFMIVLLFGHASKYDKIRDRVDAAFVYRPFAPYLTVFSNEQDDHVEVLATMIYRHLNSYDIDQEVNTYIEFNAFNMTYHRRHASVREKIEKLLIFRDNVRRIREHNAKPGRKYTMGINHFGDITGKQFLSMLRSAFSPPDNAQHRADVGSSASALGAESANVSSVQVLSDDDIDYRRGDYMTPVKDQGRCGSCWAFASIGVFEAFLKNKRSHKVTLSEQELVDCVSECYGCNGGAHYYAYEYLAQHGVHEDAIYPYCAKSGFCKTIDNRPLFKLESFGYAEKPDMVHLLKVRGPLTSQVAVSDQWQFYQSGILDDCDVEVNHAIVLAGVGKDNNGKFWILKNSWSTDWGENGYVRLAHGSDKYEGECGLDMFAIYPLA